MKSKSFDGMVCSIARALETIGDRWAILILRDLSMGLSRYEDLRQSSGITHATLSDRLKHLEENDLIERRQYQSNPERHEYVLTRKGRDTSQTMGKRHRARSATGQHNTNRMHHNRKAAMVSPLR